MIRKHWSLLRGDWAREYHRDLMAEVDDGLSWSDFVALLVGLSDRSRWRRVISNEPIEVSSAGAQALISTM